MLLYVGIEHFVLISMYNYNNTCHNNLYAYTIRTQILNNRFKAYCRLH